MDFNDYIESSEYLALIDLIAFLGQNISFRTDLNARENFIVILKNSNTASGTNAAQTFVNAFYVNILHSITWNYKANTQKSTYNNFCLYY